MLGKGGSSAQTPLTVDAHISQFVADHLIGKESLDNADLTIKVAQGALTAKGQGHIFGAPAQFEINRVGDGPPIAVINGDARRCRARQGRVAGDPRRHRPDDGACERGSRRSFEDQGAGPISTLTRTAIAAGLIGMTKPAGRAAKVEFTVQPGDDRMLIEPITIDVASLQGRGGIELERR